jgi:undecaprenyl-diphosphatase
MTVDHLHPFEREFWTNMSFFGSSICYVFIILTLLSFQHFALAFKFFALLCIMYAITTLIRMVYYKERPIAQAHHNFFEKIDSSSFPSMHAMRATSLYTWLIVLYSPLIYISIMSIVVLLVLVSRVMLGKHFIVDLIAGSVIGVILTILVHLFL